MHNDFTNSVNKSHDIFILAKKLTIEYHDDDEGHVFIFCLQAPQYFQLSTYDEFKAFFLQKVNFYQLAATFMTLGLKILVQIKKLKRLKDLQTKFEGIPLAL